MDCCGEHVSLTLDSVGKAVSAVVAGYVCCQKCETTSIQWQLAYPVTFCWRSSNCTSRMHCVQLGLHVAAAKLVPVGFGIRKMQITAVIEDAKVESMDSIIEEEIVRDGESEYIQSIDVVSFNKL